MKTLVNNDEEFFLSGEYGYKSTGSLDLQIKLADEGFDTLEDGVFIGVTAGLLTIPSCWLKVINGSSASFIIGTTKSF
tara:strand:+ start:2861 stop:3094 length:234 start_codon:yes stop_codon:yes gene_type:complete